MTDQDECGNRRPHKITYHKRTMNHRVEEDGDYRIVIFYPIAPPINYLDMSSLKGEYPTFSKKRPWWKRLLRIK